MCVLFSHPLISFLAGEHLKLGYLSPYLDSLYPNFTSGVNFAVSGATLLPKFVPFALSVQTRQYIRFRNRSLELESIGNAQNLITEDGFLSAVYMIDIGQNDLLLSLYASNLTYAPVAAKIPSFIEEIKVAVQVNHLEGVWQLVVGCWLLAFLVGLTN